MMTAPCPAAPSSFLSKPETAPKHKGASPQRETPMNDTTLLITSQDDANRLIPPLLQTPAPRAVVIVADPGRPIYLTRIRPPGEAHGIDAIGGAWSDGPTSEAWPALTRVIIEGAGEWVRMLAIDCRAAGVTFEQNEPLPTPSWRRDWPTTDGNLTLIIGSRVVAEVALHDGPNWLAGFHGAWGREWENCGSQAGAIARIIKAGKSRGASVPWPDEA